MLQKCYALLALLMFVVDSNLAQIEYPISDIKNNNLAGRRPLFSPKRCKDNELLYPGDQANDWICDCAPATLYHPESDACYPAFHQGPCQKEHMLVLGAHKIIPECIKNDCKVDGQILINNQCYEFGNKRLCPNAEYSYVLGVDPATLQVNCVKLSTAVPSMPLVIGTLFGEQTEPVSPYDLSKVELCARGTKRAIQGRCPEV